MIQISRATLTAIYRYPVKGLTGERLSDVTLEAGATLPFDRAYAIENGPSPFDATAPRYLPKTHFLMLMRNEALARLTARFDDATHVLTLSEHGRETAAGDLRTPEGRRVIEDLLAAFMSANTSPGALRGPPRVLSSAGHSFSDVSAKCLHIVNMESVRALATLIGVPIDPLRFRPNIIIDGLPAWGELDWNDKTLSAAGGVRLKVFKRTERCAATNVDPATGARDLNIPTLLSRTLGHTDFGIYARCETAGLLRQGDVFDT
ncbi:MAG: MOSC domain-containing protein [Hyphomicrobium sp.]